MQPTAVCLVVLCQRKKKPANLGRVKVTNPRSRAMVKIESPHMSFILKGSQILALRLKSWFKYQTPIQEYGNENTKFIINLCMNYMVHVFYVT